MLFWMISCVQRTTATILQSVIVAMKSKSLFLDLVYTCPMPYFDVVHKKIKIGHKINKSML